MNAAEVPARRERPLRFSSEEVRAIRAGRKTQARRVVKSRVAREIAEAHGQPTLLCPYGVPGDLLWTQETWRAPRRLSRALLVLADVRVEVLHDISEADVLREGIQSAEEFATQWDCFNAGSGHGWKTNPWVWVLVFNSLNSR